MHVIFKTKDLFYQLRDKHIVSLTKFEDITDGKYTNAHYGSHIWNALPNQVKECINIVSFFLKDGERPMCLCNNMCDALHNMYFVYITVNILHLASINNSFKS